MTSVAVLSPAMSTPSPRPKRGLASIKTMFSSKRHTVAEIPVVEDPSLSPEEPTIDSPSMTPDSTVSSTSHKSHGSVTSLFAPNQKRAQEKAAEKEKKEQVKQAIQLSTVDEQGAFLPPTPLEKGYKEHFIDNDEDHFYTIISTPPERVRSFLSAASTISPGMFSLPSNKIKRHTFPSFSSANSTAQWSAPGSDSSEEDMNASPTLPPLVPPKDTHYTTSTAPAGTKKRADNRVQISYLTGADDLTEALSDSMSSLLSSGEVPELMDDDDHYSGSEASSPNASPRHSTSCLQDDHLQSGSAKH
ncbi:hypothetical protein KVV02_001096 [Mortierella alpina]|uniref:Uncharacterized protein n=1 Tax=Mortierella alpina TaxID=64518 RepID=A0A9P8D025_MORAP|nr:hypothetical protein KVV02_001096 [Mortierella alpina]